MRCFEWLGRRRTAATAKAAAAAAEAAAAAKAATAAAAATVAAEAAPAEAVAAAVGLIHGTAHERRGGLRLVDLIRVRVRG